MKNVKRILTSVLAMALVCAFLLTGCSIPKIHYNSIPDTAATYGDGKVLTSAQYLAYLYLEFENLYFNQGLYQYASYGMDPWAQTFPYGDDDEKLLLSDYIIRATQDNIKRQIVLEQLLKDYGLKWIEEDEAEINESLKKMEKDAYLPLGFNNESYGYALKNANLNERSAFYGLYGKGGQKEIKEDDLKKYFADNYLSYKIINISLTDKNNKELDKEGEEYKKIAERMDKYLKLYEEKGFDEAKKAYDADVEEDEKNSTTTTTGKGGSTTTTTAAPTTTTTTTTTTAADTTTTTGDGHDHDHEEEEDKDPNRIDADATTMDEDLVKAIRSVDVGKAKIVEYKAGGSTPTIALIVRMDTNVDRNGKEGGLYEDSVENIIYEMKYEDFDKEVDGRIAELNITYNDKVVNSPKCKPELFLDVINNL